MKFCNNRGESYLYVLLITFLLLFSSFSVVAQAPSNDDFANATLITLTNGEYCSADADLTNVGATADESRPSAWHRNPLANVWFKVQASASGELAIKIQTGAAKGTLQSARTALFDAQGNAVKAVRPYLTTGDVGLSAAGLTPNDFYYISVDQGTGEIGKVGTFTLCVSDEATNDYRLNALELTLDASGNYCSADAEFSQALASSDHDSPRPNKWSRYVMANVWFKVQAPASGELSFNIQVGNGKGTLEYVRTAFYDDQGAEVTSVDPYGQFEGGGFSVGDLTPGEYYYLSVDQGSGEWYKRGTFTICVSDEATNDFRLGAHELTLDANGDYCSADEEFNNINASSDHDSPRPGKWSRHIMANVWFKVQAPASGQLSIDLQTGSGKGTLQYPRTAFYDAQGVEVTSVDPYSQFEGGGFSVGDLTPGEYYYFSVDQGSGEWPKRGTFSICLSDEATFDYRLGAHEISLDTNGDYCSADAEFSNIDASSDHSRPGRWSRHTMANVWFKVQAPTSGELSFDLQVGNGNGTLQYVRTALYDDQGVEVISVDPYDQYDGGDFSVGELTPGEYYYLAVDQGSGEWPKRGTFSLCVSDEATNDYRVNATELILDTNGNFCSADAEFSNVNASADHTRPSNWSRTPLANKWFKFQAPASGELAISVLTGNSKGTLQYARAALYDDQWNAIVSSDQVGQYDGVGFSVENLTPNAYYYLNVDQGSGEWPNRGTFTVCLTNQATYDSRLNALELTLDSNGDYCSADAEFDNSMATADHDQPSNWVRSPLANVWFKVLAPASGELSINLEVGNGKGTLEYVRGALFDELGNDVKSIRAHYQNEGTGFSVGDLTPGQYYYLSVDQGSGESYRRGTFSVCLSDEATNDYRLAALELTLDANGNYTSADAEFDNIRASYDHARPTNWVRSPLSNVWFKVQAPASGQLSVDVQVGNEKGTLEYARTALFDALGQEVSSVRAFQPDSDMGFSAAGLSPGAYYYLSVDQGTGEWNKRGSFTLQLSDEATNDYRLSATELTFDSNGQYSSPDAAFDNIKASSDHTKPSTWFRHTLANVWFKFQAPPSSAVSIDLETGNGKGTLEYIRGALFDAQGNEVISKDATGGQFEAVNLTHWGLNPGEYYYLAVDQGTNEWQYRGSFSVSMLELTTNDNRLNAFELNLDSNGEYCSADAEFTNTYGTPDHTKPSLWSGAVAANVWFKVQTTTGQLSFNIESGGAKGNLEYARAALFDDAGNEVASVDHDTGFGPVGFSTAGLTPGADYYLAIDEGTGVEARHGTFTLCVTDQATNDYRLNAIPLTMTNGSYCSADAEFTNALGSADGPRPSFWVSDPLANVWFKVQTTTGELGVTVKTGGSLGNLEYPRAALYDAAGTEVSSVGIDTGFGELGFSAGDLNPGADYYLAVDVGTSVAQRRGTFSLCISEEATNDYRLNALPITLNNGSYCSADAEFTNGIGSADWVKPANWTGQVKANVWFKVQTTTGELAIDVKTGSNEGDLENPRVALFDAAGNEVTSVNHTSPFADVGFSASGLTNNADYYISVDEGSGLAQRRGTFTLCVTDQATNDSRLGALPITLNNGSYCSADAEFTNTTGSPDGDKPANWALQPQANVWYKVQTTTGQLSVEVKTGDNEGNLQYARAALFDQAGNEVTSVDYDRYFGDIGFSATGLTTGVYYYIAVDEGTTVSARRGTFTLCITDQATNDYRLNAHELVLNASGEYHSADAEFTQAFGSPDHVKPANWALPLMANVWFKVQAPSSGQLKIDIKTGDTEGSLQYARGALFDEAGNEITSVDQDGYFRDIGFSATGLTPGNYYYLSVDEATTVWARRGTFTLSITDEASNDYRLNATELLLDNNGVYQSADAEFSNSHGSPDHTKPSNWGGNPMANVWFKVKATATGQLSLDLKSGGSYGSLEFLRAALFDEAGNEIQSVDYDTRWANIGFSVVGLTPNDYYYIAVDEGTPLWVRRGSFTMTITDKATHDERMNALAIPFNSSFQYCSSDAAFTTSIGSSDHTKPSTWVHPPQANVWFKFTAPADGSLTLDLKTGSNEGSLELPRMAVFNENGDEVKAIDYQGQWTDVNLVVDNLTAGENYYISVDQGNSGAWKKGSFTFCAAYSADGSVGLFNDAEIGAIDVTALMNSCSTGNAYTNIGASNDAPSSYSSITKNVWFKFDAPASGEVTIRLTNQSLGRGIMVLLDDQGNTIRASMNYHGLPQPELSAVGLTPGATYHLTIGNPGTTWASSDFDICLEDKANYDFQAGAKDINSLMNDCTDGGIYNNFEASTDAPANYTSLHKNVWFKFNAPASGAVTVRMTNQNMNRGTMVLLDEQGNVASAAMNWYNLDDPELSAIGLQSGATYYLTVGVPGTTYGPSSFGLCLEDKANYDHQEGAKDITSLFDNCTTDATYSTREATNDAPAAFSNIYKNVWFKFTAPASGQATIRMTNHNLGRGVMVLLDDQNQLVGAYTNYSEFDEPEMSFADLQAGSTYYLTIGSPGTTYSPSDFDLCLDDEASYDLKEGALDVSGMIDTCSDDAFYTTEKATTDGSTGLNYDVWFKFNAPADGNITLRVNAAGDQGDLGDGRMKLYDASDNLMVTSSHVNGLMEISRSGLTPGAVYYLAVGTASLSSVHAGSFTLCVDSQPTYDLIEGALDVNAMIDQCSADAEYSTFMATGGQSSLNFDVFFKFDAPANGIMTIRAETGGEKGTMGDPRMKLLTADGTEIATGMAIDGLMEISKTDLTPNALYYISVGTPSTSSVHKGTFTLCLDSQSTYDNIAGALDINTLIGSCSSDAEFSTLHATTDNLGVSALESNVWFKFYAPISQSMNFTVKTDNGLGTINDGRIVLFDDAGTLLNSVDIGSNPEVQLNAENLTTGSLYYVSVGSRSPSSVLKGTFTLCIEDPAPVYAEELWAIQSGDWANPLNWSLTEGGPAANVLPTEITTVHIKGYDITMNQDLPVTFKRIVMNSDDGTSTKLDVRSGELIVIEKIELSGSGTILKKSNGSRIRVIGSD